MTPIGPRFGVGRAFSHGVAVNFRNLPLLAALLALGPAPASATDPTPEAIDKLVADTLREWNVPGAAVVIVRDGKTVHLRGYGTKQAGEKAPVSADTLFPIASCTKAFTSALIASLVDDEKLGWDDPVRKHLPTFRLSDPKADALVTIRDLLTHRTGVGSHDMLWYRAPWNRSEILRRIGKLPLSGQFRGSYHYSSLMFMAAGQAAVNRGDAPWEDLLRERITGPLGMSGVTFSTAELAKAKDRASGHRRGSDGKPEPMPPYEAAEPNPAGTVSASVQDLAAWLKFQLADGKVGEKQIVSAKNLRETRIPHTPIRRDAGVRALYPETVQTTYAMGWVVFDYRGKSVVAHGGAIDGFRTQITLLPEENFGIAIVNNLHDTKMNIALTSALIDRFLGLETKDWNAYYRKLEADERAAKQAATEKRDRGRKPDTRPTLPLQAYTGEYLNPAYGTAKVTLREGKLTLEWSSFRANLDHFETDTFRVSDGFLTDELVPFHLRSGRIAGLTLLGQDFVKQ